MWQSSQEASEFLSHFASSEGFFIMNKELFLLDNFKTVQTHHWILEGLRPHLAFYFTVAAPAARSSHIRSKAFSSKLTPIESSRPKRRSLLSSSLHLHVNRRLGLRCERFVRLHRQFSSARQNLFVIAFAKTVDVPFNRSLILRHFFP